MADERWDDEAAGLREATAHLLPRPGLAAELARRALSRRAAGPVAAAETAFDAFIAAVSRVAAAFFLPAAACAALAVWCTARAPAPEVELVMTLMGCPR